MLVTSPETLALGIKQHRKQQKLSQATVAELVGLKQATVSAFENNPQATKLDTLFRILASTNLELHLHPRGSLSKPFPWEQETES